MGTRKQLESAFQKFNKGLELVRQSIEEMKAAGNIDNAKIDYQQVSPYKSLWEMRDRYDAMIKEPLIKMVMHDLRYPGKKKK